MTVAKNLPVCIFARMRIHVVTHNFKAASQQPAELHKTHFFFPEILHEKVGKYPTFCSNYVEWNVKKMANHKSYI